MRVPFNVFWMVNFLFCVCVCVVRICSRNKKYLIFPLLVQTFFSREKEPFYLWERHDPLLFIFCLERTEEAFNRVTMILLMMMMFNNSLSPPTMSTRGSLLLEEISLSPMTGSTPRLLPFHFHHCDCDWHTFSRTTLFPLPSPFAFRCAFLALQNSNRKKVHS